MSYDPDLAGELRALLDGVGPVTERKMFGGLAFLLDGHMVAGVVRDSVMARLGPDATEEALRHDNVRPMDFTGRPSRGMVFADRPDGAGISLQELVSLAVAYVRTLPPK